MTRLPALVLLLLATPLRAQVAPADTAGLGRLRETWIAAYDAGDGAAMEDLYVDDAVRMPYDAPAQVGKRAILDGYAASFARRAMTRDLHFDVAEVEVAGDLAVERGAYREIMRPKSGGPRVLIEEGKYVTLAARGPDGAWRYRWSIFNRDAPAHPLEE